jgi:hypothetical protein
MICQAEVVFVGVGPHQVEVRLIGVHLGQEISTTGEIFQIEGLIFLEAVYGFDIALIGMRGGEMRTCWLSPRALGKSPLNSPPLSVCRTRSRRVLPQRSSSC